MFLIPAVVILIIKSPNFVVRKIYGQYRAIKSPKFHILDVREKKISLEALILHFQGEDLDESLTMMKT